MNICLTLNTFVCGLFFGFQVVIKARHYPILVPSLRSTCPYGNYRSADGCQQCLKECHTCNSQYECTSCISQCKGTYCQHCQDGFYRNKDDSCQPCLKECLTCSNANVCTTCVAGHKGTLCQYCKDGFYLNEGSCYQCNTNCLHDTCDYHSGECIDGCKKGWSGGRCNEACATQSCTSCQRSNKYYCSCSFGYYGPSCESKCSSRCVAKFGTRQCNETTGACNAGCVEGWTGSNCSEACDMNCITCDSKDESICHKCSTGFYGQSCDKECSSNCVKAAISKRQCRKHDGQCDGCVVGWTGHACTERCAAQCTSCDRQNRTACTSCKPGYYGQSCNIECSEYCSKTSDDSRICQHNNGTCLDECVIGYRGDRCDVPCDAGCSSGCDRESGLCQSCQPAYFGPSCQHHCNATCYDPGNGSNVCQHLSGECLFDCSQLLCSLDGTKDADKSDYVAVICGVVGSAVIVVLMVAAISGFMFLNKRRRKNTDPEDRVTYAYTVTIEDDNTDGNTDDSVYSVPVKKRSFNEHVDERQCTAQSKVCKPSPLHGPVTIEQVIYGNIGGPSGLSVDEDDDSVEELFEDEVKNGDPTDADTPNAEDYYNISGMARSRIQVEAFREHVASISTEEFANEFNKLPKGRTRPYDDAVKPMNVSKNRYNGIYPYDSTRVKLTGNGGDYINASYIQGFDENEKTYIASLGPTKKCMKGFVDFWKMVWQEKVDKIVMLTNFMEKSKMKCEKYWPDVGEHKTYGDINVHCISAERYADFIVTTLTMNKDSKVVSINHFHFTAWPDQGTPEDVASLVGFRASVEHVPKITNGPTVVHCSAGVGRTGTYIALDFLIREGRTENCVDVYGCVLGLRGQRVFMVQNVEQYRFLHYCLSYSLTSKCDQIASKDFCTISTNEIQEQFHLLGTVNVLHSDEEKMAIESNEKENYQNRKGASIPGDAHRPRLVNFSRNTKSDYINAIYVDGYREKHRYIIVQTPLTRTVEDFLGLVLQENCSCIISLDPVEITSTQDIGHFLPDVNHEVSVGTINVSCVQRETTSEYILSKLILGVKEESTEEPKTILHYQYTDWPDGSLVPSSIGSFLNLVLASRPPDREPNMPHRPVIINCLAGGYRSGLFAVVANILEKVNSEQQASIVNIVNQVRARRPRAVSTEEQFKYCYELASLYVENHSVFSN